MLSPEDSDRIGIRGVGVLDGAAARFVLGEQHVLLRIELVDALADRLNRMPKYVVSSTLEHPDWNNSRVLKGDVVTEVSKLKQDLDGEIVVPGSYQLARTLIEHDLLDELRVVVFPVVLGASERLFGETTDKEPLRLIDTKTIGDSLVLVTFLRTDTVAGTLDGVQVHGGAHLGHPGTVHQVGLDAVVRESRQEGFRWS